MVRLKGRGLLGPSKPLGNRAHLHHLRALSEASGPLKRGHLWAQAARQR